MTTGKPLKVTLRQAQAKPKAKPTRSQRRTQKMRELFPDITKEMLWSRKRHDGFATLPRTMPLVMKIIDARSEKGQPAGHTLFCLWARAMDHPYVVIDRPKIYAAETGLIGERAENTWKKRMATLVKLGFIAAKEGTAGTYHHVVLLNPNVTVARLHDKGEVQGVTWEFFKERAEEVGALPEVSEALEAIKAQKVVSAKVAKKVGSQGSDSNKPARRQKSHQKGG